MTKYKYNPNIQNILKLFQVIIFSAVIYKLYISYLDRFFSFFTVNSVVLIFISSIFIFLINKKKKYKKYMNILSFVLVLVSLYLLGVLYDLESIKIFSIFLIIPSIIHFNLVYPYEKKIYKKSGFIFLKLVYLVFLILIAIEVSNVYFPFIRNSIQIFYLLKLICLSISIIIFIFSQIFLLYNEKKVFYKRKIEHLFIGFIFFLILSAIFFIKDLKYFLFIIPVPLIIFLFEDCISRLKYYSSRYILLKSFTFITSVTVILVILILPLKFFKTTDFLKMIYGALVISFFLFIYPIVNIFFDNIFYKFRRRKTKYLKKLENLLTIDNSKEFSYKIIENIKNFTNSESCYLFVEQDNLEQDNLEQDNLEQDNFEQDNLEQDNLELENSNNYSNNKGLNSYKFPSSFRIISESGNSSNIINSISFDIKNKNGLINYLSSIKNIINIEDENIGFENILIEEQVFLTKIKTDWIYPIIIENKIKAIIVGSGNSLKIDKWYISKLNKYLLITIPFLLLQTKKEKDTVLCLVKEKNKIKREILSSTEIIYKDTKKVRIIGNLAKNVIFFSFKKENKKYLGYIYITSDKILKSKISIYFLQNQNIDNNIFNILNNKFNIEIKEGLIVEIYDEKLQIFKEGNNFSFLIFKDSITNLQENTIESTKNIKAIFIADSSFQEVKNYRYEKLTEEFFEKIILNIFSNKLNREERYKKLKEQINLFAENTDVYEDIEYLIEIF